MAASDDDDDDAPVIEAKRMSRMRQVLQKAIATSVDSFGDDEMRECYASLLRECPELDGLLVEWREKILADVKGEVECKFRAVCVERGVNDKLLLLEELLSVSDGDPDPNANEILTPLPDGVTPRGVLRYRRCAQKEREKAQLEEELDALERETETLERETEENAARTDVSQYPAVIKLREDIKKAVGICGDDEDEGTVHDAAVGMSLG